MWSQIALSNVGDAVIVTNSKGQIEFMNPASKTVTGWDEKCFGKELSDVLCLVDEFTHQPIENPYSRVMRDGWFGEVINHSILIKKDGTEIPIEANGTQIRDESGKFDGIVFVFRDISERRRMLSALTDSEIRYRRLFETAQDAILILEASAGCIIDANPFLTNLLGYTREELLGKELWEIGLFKDIATNRTAFDELQEKEYIRYENLPLLSKDGRSIEVEFVSNVYDMGTEKVIQCNIRDITARRRAEKALKESYQHKDEFIATLAHELRNPLAPISNAVELMRMMEFDSERVKKLRGIIIRQVKHMTRLIEDLIDISRLNRDKLELHTQRVELNDVISAAVETVRGLIEQKGQHLTVSQPDDPVTLKADPTRLAQVLMNLLNNASKYSPPTARIWLTVEKTENEVLVRVRDQGIGIAEPEQLRIFEMFAQISHSPKQQNSGLGIGLTLVKKIVELHGGMIAVHSDGPKHGSEFIIHLPLLVESPPYIVPVWSVKEQSWTFTGRIRGREDTEDCADIFRPGTRDNGASYIYRSQWRSAP
ncbi:MAG TPA: PAS domain S-box protein [Anaerolineales bacterium]|nr:PAS domain S-box protein [Anaerolineales bacterium]